MLLQQKVLGSSMSYTRGQELQMPEEKSGTCLAPRHGHIPSLHGIFDNVDGRRCAAMTLCNWDTHSRAPMVWRVARDRKSPQAAGKGIRTQGDARKHLLPLVAFTEEPHMDFFYHPRNHDPRAKGSAHNIVSPFNITILSQLQPL